MDEMPDRPRSLGRLLNFATADMNRLCQAMLAEHGLTLAQWVVLSALWRRDGLLVNDLARYAGSNAPAASRLADRMEREGLVRRCADEHDGRAVRVHLTAKGRALEGLATFHERVNEHLLSGFSEREAASLLGMLERVAENAREARQAYPDADASEARVEPGGRTRAPRKRR